MITLVGLITVPSGGVFHPSLMGYIGKDRSRSKFYNGTLMWQDSKGPGIPEPNEGLSKLIKVERK